MHRTVELGVMWDRVRVQRSIIFWMVLVSTLTVGVVSWFLPPWFRSQSSLLPPGEEDSGLGMATLLKGVRRNRHVSHSADDKRWE